MKATGLVRRIADLGRIVVPQENRRTLRIREGDALEIFTDREAALAYLETVSFPTGTAVLLRNTPGSASSSRAVVFPLTPD